MLDDSGMRYRGTADNKPVSLSNVSSKGKTDPGWIMMTFGISVLLTCMLAALIIVPVPKNTKSCDDTHAKLLEMNSLLLNKEAAIKMLEKQIVQLKEERATMACWSMRENMYLQDQVDILKSNLTEKQHQVDILMINLKVKDDVIRKLQDAWDRRDNVYNGARKWLTKEYNDMKSVAFFSFVVAGSLVPVIIGVFLYVLRYKRHLRLNSKVNADDVESMGLSLSVKRPRRKLTLKSKTNYCCLMCMDALTLEMLKLGAPCSSLCFLRKNSPIHRVVDLPQIESGQLPKAHDPSPAEQTEQARVPFEDDDIKTLPRPRDDADDGLGTGRPKPIGIISPCASTEALCEISSTEDQRPGCFSANLVSNIHEAYDIMNRLVEANQESNDLEGLVFAKKNLATAIVGSKGAVLSFPDQSVTLRIPEGALTSEQPILVYRPVNPEDLQYQPLDKPFVAYTPIIHCAPEGTKFERPVELTFGHCAAFKENQQRSLTVLRRANETSPWEEINQDAANVQIDPNMMTVEISEFSDYVGCSNKDLLQETALISAVHRGQRIGTNIYSVMKIAGFYQNNLDLIRMHSKEIQEANVIVDCSKIIHLEGDSDLMQFSTTSRTFTVNKTVGYNSCYFEMSPIQGANIQHPSTDLATISLRQTKNMPFATVAIQRNGHRIEVNNASSLQKTKMYRHPTQAEVQPHQTKLLSQIPPSGQQIASTLGLTVIDGRLPNQGAENHGTAIQVNSVPRYEVFSNDSAEPSGGATSTSSDEVQADGTSAPDGAPSDSRPPEVEESKTKEDGHASLEKNGAV